MTHAFLMNYLVATNDAGQYFDLCDLPAIFDKVGSLLTEVAQGLMESKFPDMEI